MLDHKKDHWVSAEINVVYAKISVHLISETLGNNIKILMKGELSRLLDNCKFKVFKNNDENAAGLNTFAITYL